MEKFTHSTAYEYIALQLKAFVVNRLCQRPHNSEELTASFSSLVDYLSTTKKSMEYVLDGLYRDRVVRFKYKQGTRVYSMRPFNGDYMFDLCLSKVEEIIAKYKVPYLSKGEICDEELYFTKDGDCICIYINAPLIVFDKQENETANTTTDISASEQSKNAESTNIQSDSLLRQDACSLDDSSNPTSNFESPNEISSEDNSSVTSIQDQQINTGKLDEEISQDSSNKSDDISIFKGGLEDNTQDFHTENNDEDIVNESFFDAFSFDNTSSTNGVTSENGLAKTTTINEKLDEPTPLNTNPIVDNRSNDQIADPTFDDFAGAFSEPVIITNESQNANVEKDDDYINNLINAALMQANITQEDLQKRQIEPARVEELPIEQEHNDVEESQNKEIEHTTGESESSKSGEDFDISFTEVSLPTTPTESDDERNKRIEETLRKLEGFTANVSKTQEINEVQEVQEETIEVVEKTQSYDELPQEKRLKDKDKQGRIKDLRGYIEEQEVINNYDWEKKLQRALVDANNESEEEIFVSEEENIVVSTYAELKDIMEKKNYKFKPYTNFESVSFYNQNYIFSNKIAKDTAIYTYIFMILEIFISYFALDKFANMGFTPYLLLGLSLLIIPIIFFAKYYVFKDKRKPANFHFRISLVTALMIYVNLMVMVVLLAFFLPSVNVNVNEVSSMISTIFYPAGIFLAIPISVCIYSILYGSRKYHLR